MMRVVHIFCVIMVMTGTGYGESAVSEQATSDRMFADQSDTLMLQARAIFGILPRQMPGNQLDTPEKIALGRMLYFETDLSINGTQSCSSCHPINGQGSGADNQITSPGALGKLGTRNAPTVLNAGFQIAQFWDGRERTLAEQAKGPILNSMEMGMPHVDACLERMKRSEEIRLAFGVAYPGQTEPVTYDNLAQSIAAFERTLISRSRFDLFVEGDAGALTVLEKEGLGLFMNEGCIRCHSGPLLGGMLFQKVGVYHPYQNTSDTGRFTVTKKENDRYVFKVASLRNVTLTAPYFHDGMVATLAEAIDDMAWMELDTRLSSREIDAILRFLTSLADVDHTTAPLVGSNMKTSSGWKPPAKDSIPRDKQGDLIRYGYELLMRTQAYLGPEAKTPMKAHSRSNLACGNCHQEGGTRMYGLPWMGVTLRYPQFSNRTAREVTLEDRINDCMERSMNGRALPENGREMKGMVSYMTWLGRGVPQELAGLLKTELSVPDRRADLNAGSRIYQEFCQSCHGNDGSGYRARSAATEGVFVTPPLWGAGSFNTGAGMHRLLTAAAFVKGNMPLGTPWDRPVLTDEQAYDVAAYINSRERPKLPLTDKDWPDLSKKPVDCPYPPYNDGFTQEQHQFGPFGPIKKGKAQ